MGQWGNEAMTFTLVMLVGLLTQGPARQQAVIETDLGTIVIDLLPETAPNHVGLFTKLARAGAYNDTSFAQVAKYGAVVSSEVPASEIGRAHV